MCGIAGEYQFNNRNTPLSNMEKVNLRQEFRGPDAEGVYCHDGLALGHRRLKIFDLTDRAAQPMVDHTLGLALVFNGALYNFRGLREILKGRGYQFISDSDTEVLLKAYHAWGEECLLRFRGMFSFAIWERDTGKLIIARDRMGIKPLYYASTSSGFRFASTLPALLEFEDIDTRIDPHALHYYLTFHAVPEPLTILAGIKKLSPGHVMTVHPGGDIEQRCYWNYQINDAVNDGKRSEESWLEETAETLRMAVERQLSADVPVGVLLSGGLDSSLLVALAAQAEHKRIETFSIGFESAKGEPGDEFYYSDMVARHFGTRHNKLFISNKQLAHSLAECVKAMSEPMVSHDNIGFHLLSKAVAQHVKVALSGQGADEIFAGYQWFQGFPSGKAGPEHSAELILSQVADRPFREYERLVSPHYRSENHAASFLIKLCKQNGSEHPIDNLLAYESTFALANGPLCRVDNMTMSASLEARVPFLDEAVVNLAASMPLRFKLPNGGKYIVKELGRKLLPSEVVDRPKGYFPVPALKYLQGSTLELMREVLSAKNVQNRGIFNLESINTLLDRPEEHLTPSGASKLWQVGLLEYWLQQQGI